MRVDVPLLKLQEVRNAIPKESITENEYLYLDRILRQIDRGFYVNTRSYMHEIDRIKSMSDEKLRTRLERINRIAKMETFIFALIECGKHDVLKHALKHRVYRTDLK